MWLVRICCQRSRHLRDAPINLRNLHMQQIATKFNNLPDLKTHFTKEHEIKDSFVEVFHVKQSRENKEEFEGKNYFYRELFPELLQQS